MELIPSKVVKDKNAKHPKPEKKHPNPSVSYGFVDAVLL